MQKISHILKNEIFRYLLVGSTAYCIEIATIILLTKTGLSGTAATSISFWIGLSVAFVMQKFITFNDRNSKMSVLGKQSVLYLVLVAFNYAFTLLFISRFPDNIIVVSRTIALIITTTWNFFFYKKLFKQPKPE